MATVRPSSTGCTLLFLTCIVAAAAGCGHEIGDSCGTSLDCSQQSSRVCDRTQNGGYCTISPCERGTCPEESTCVQFRPTEDRLAVTYCMRKCSDDGDCRDDEGYRCKSAPEFGTCEAKTLDGEGTRFCANAPTMVATDAGVVEPVGSMMCVDPSSS
jgi:hypothetical protein